MLQHPSYTSEPVHMLGRTDTMDSWDLDTDFMPGMSPHSTLVSMPHMQDSTAFWSEPALLPSAQLHSKSSSPKQLHASRQQPSPSSEAAPSEPRPDANSSGPIRCWSDRCSGREFSSIGNYRRHFREQHRVSRKFCCQRCGRPFSRSTARNLHYEKKKCRSIQFDENGIPVSLPFADGSESESFSPAASLDASSSDESRHASIDSAFSPYMSAISAHGMTYAEPATQPPYSQLAGPEQELAFEGDHLAGWVDASQGWGSSLPWSYTDQAIDATAATRAHNLLPQATSTAWSQPGLMGC